MQLLLLLICEFRFSADRTHFYFDFRRFFMTAPYFLLKWSKPRVITLTTGRTFGGLNGSPETGGQALVESGG